MNLKTVAAAAGVSISTASRALRRCRDVSADTITRVMRVAEELNYTPNPSLAALALRGKASRHDTAHGTPLAYVTLLPEGHGQQNRDKTLFDLMHECVTRLGYSITYHRFRPGENLRREFEVLWSRGVAGIVIGHWMDSAFPEYVNWSRFSVVTCGQYSFPTSFHRVRRNQFRAADLALTELHARGYERVAMLLTAFPDAWHSRDNEQYLAALRLYHSAAAKPRNRVVPAFIPRHLVSQPRQMAAPFVLDYIKRSRCDALLSAWVSEYYSVIESGVRVPEQLGFATLHADSRDRWSANLSGVSVQLTEKIQVAAELLDQQVRLGRTGVPKVPFCLHLDPVWCEGVTLRPKQ